MAEDARVRIGELLLRLWSLDHSPEQVELAEEAVRLADAHGELSLAFEAREALVEAATFAGFPEKALLAFTWCLGQCDRDPDRFPEEALLWHYKWIAADLPYFPQVARERILEVHADMQRRYERCGRSLQPIHKIRWLAAMRMGEREEAERHYTLARQTPRDAGSDCPACELDDEVCYLLYTDRLEAAVEAAGPILGGRMSCASVPHVTLGALLRPLLRLGRLEEATRYHRWGYRLVAGNRKLVDTVGDHLEFLALTGNLAAGQRVLEGNLLGALITTDLDDRFRFHTAAAVLLARLASRGGAGPLTLRLPPAWPLHRADGRYALEDLRAWFEREALALADRFDARNGNDAFRRRYASRLSEADGLAVEHPLGLDGGAPA